MTINIQYKLLNTTEVPRLMILYNYVGFGGEKEIQYKKK